MTAEPAIAELQDNVLRRSQERIDIAKHWSASVGKCCNFPRDPNFAGKAGPILDLYQRVWKGVPLGSDD